MPAIIRLYAILLLSYYFHIFDGFVYNLSLRFILTQTTLLSKFMEPLIIVVLGGIVGTILIAMYLPLFKLGQTF